MDKYAFRPSTAAFTLIELSIVLVIIGLIAGGILVGGEMIRMAETRRLIGQIESYNTAVMAFRGKYNAFPGDFSNASSFFPQAANGNGNGRLEGISSIDGLPSIGLICLYAFEYPYFWVHLSLANLVNGKYDGSNIPNRGFPTTTGNRGIVAYAQTAKEHRFAIGKARVLTNTLYDMSLGIVPVFSHTDAQIMDRKWDDGQPNTGMITVWGTVVVCNNPPFCSSTITTATTPSQYNLQSTALLRMYFKMTSW